MSSNSSWASRWIHLKLQGWIFSKFHTRSSGGRLLRSQVPSGNLNIFIRYLGSQWTVGAHTPQFCSTDQYYRTVKYQLHRTTGDEDTSTLRFSDLKSWVSRIRNGTSDRYVHLTKCPVTKYKNLIIFIVSGPMKLILGSSIVLMSTSKL